MLKITTGTPFCCAQGVISDVSRNGKLSQWPGRFCYSSPQNLLRLSSGHHQPHLRPTRLSRPEGRESHRPGKTGRTPLKSRLSARSSALLGAGRAAAGLGPLTAARRPDTTEAARANYERCKSRGGEQARPPLYHQHNLGKDKQAGPLFLLQPAGGSGSGRWGGESAAVLWGLLLF